MTFLPLLLLAPAIILGTLLVVRLDELLAVSVRDGRATLVRGSISPALLADFQDVVRRFPEERGELIVKRRAHGPELVVKKLPEALAQRLRNVFALHAKRLVRDATVAAPARSRMMSVLFLVSLGLAVTSLVVMNMHAQATMFGGGAPFFGAGEAALEREDMNALVRAMRSEIGAESEDEAYARGRPHIEALRRTGVLPREEDDTAHMMLAYGPYSAITLSDRAIFFPLTSHALRGGARGMAEVQERLRAAGLRDATVRCSSAEGCVLRAAGVEATIVLPGELPRVDEDLCMRARIAHRLAQVLVPAVRAQAPSQALLLLSEDEDASDGEMLTFVRITAEERRVLAAWDADFSQGEPMDFGAPAPLELDPACRPAP